MSKPSHLEAQTEAYANPFRPPLPTRAKERFQWGRLYGTADALGISGAVSNHRGPVVILTGDAATADRLERELRFFLADRQLPVTAFPDWETLPYDVFSPLPEIISERLATLYRLPDLSRGAVIAAVPTALQRLPPRQYLDQHALLLDVGDRLDIEALRARLARAGYRCVPQVMEHGEFAVRGSLLDLYPMGSAVPYRVDLLDEEIESIRAFDPETQRSTERVERVRLLPAREFPLHEEALGAFRRAFRAAFSAEAARTEIYRQLGAATAPGGIEYYLPLFFEHTDTLFDYLPANTLLVHFDDLEEAAEHFLQDVQTRYEQRRHDIERPLLPPQSLYLTAEQLQAAARCHRRVRLLHHEIESGTHLARGHANFGTTAPPAVRLQARGTDPAAALRRFLGAFTGRVLFAAETAGRREVVLESLRAYQLQPAVVASWRAFTDGEEPLAITVAPLEHGLLLEHPPLAVVTETQLFGERAQQRRRRKTAGRDPEQIIRDLTELRVGAPVVHEEHGVGRYAGLRMLQVGDVSGEFLTLEYANGDKLYVPVSSLHLVSRYTGSSPESAPLHRLGGDQWQRIKRRAAEKARDVAAELLDIHARREARRGYPFDLCADAYPAFADSFPFEETPDQRQAIEAVLADMHAESPMDRVVCGDVGFGKTEVAMRAAFIATHNGKQVAILVPTTLLAQQHLQNFRDRFADWPVRVEALSRLRSRKEQQTIVAQVADGRVDIVIGTHKLLQAEMRFKALGLVVIDEEHRFGVRHKERLKALRAEVDLLTLTATPIPRTLNMSMAGIRDLSIIATPPTERHAIKTFVSEWNDALVMEACQRETRRGGQVYVLHNEVRTIEKIAEQMHALVPEARIRVAHGQMRERDLESVMLDFYHRRFNVLVCTTIIESGIDVPTANTIVMNRADKLGLAQLHQLRGRVGRSHHRAYAYLIVPPRRSMTAEAIKRLEAIEAMEDLGAGFTLATHDLEIRGAGELLGEEQSGQIHEVGFGLYMELLQRAVADVKAGRHPDLDRPLDHGPEIDLQVPALLPEDYVPDIHTRLVMYKRLASAGSAEALRELQVEMIDRFGLLPEATRNLLRITEIKLKALPLGVRKIDIGPAGGRILFDRQANIDPARLVQLIQSRPETYRFDGEQKLRISCAMPTADDRLRGVTELLQNLSYRAAA